MNDERCWCWWMQTSHLSLKVEGSSPLRCYLLLQSICPEEKIFSRCDGIVLYLASHTVVMMMMIKEGGGTCVWWNYVFLCRRSYKTPRRQIPQNSRPKTQILIKSFFPPLSFFPLGWLVGLWLVVLVGGMGGCGSGRCGCRFFWVLQTHLWGLGCSISCLDDEPLEPDHIHYNIKTITARLMMHLSS